MMALHGTLFIDNMNFIGNLNHKFNSILIDHLNDLDYNIVSKIDTDFISSDVKGNTILLLPIASEEDYFKSTNAGWTSMISSAFGNSLNVYTSIFIFLPEIVNPIDIANIINNLDKENIVDNIWVYPKLENPYQLRDTEVKNLAWQKYLSNRE